MNLKHIMRKQNLGISHPDDCVQWASTLIVERRENGLPISQSLGELGNIDTALWEEFDDRLMQLTVQLFNGAVGELSGDYQDSGIKDTSYVRTVQSINDAARKLDIYFQIIDLRPISELGGDLSDIEIVDKMMDECGCIPIGDHWIEYSSKDGRKTLETIFEYEVRPVSPSVVQLSGNNPLADQFLDCFDDSVRFYGNDGYAPWIEAHLSGAVVQSKPLQSRYDTDFGLVLRDSEHIGFLLLAADWH